MKRFQPKNFENGAEIIDLRGRIEAERVGQRKIFEILGWIAVLPDEARYNRVKDLRRKAISNFLNKYLGQTGFSSGEAANDGRYEEENDLPYRRTNFDPLHQGRDYYDIMMEEE